jgi:hypothetical protein
MNFGSQSWVGLGVNRQPFSKLLIYKHNFEQMADSLSAKLQLTPVHGCSKEV